MLRSNIENIANQVLSKYVAKGGAYKQFEKICAGESITYKEIEADEKEFCGVFTKYLDEQKHIIINSKIDNEGRKNFTKAHELGHYFLGHQLKGHDDNINEECANKDPIEYEADYFATCLLMPEEKITSAVKSMLYRISKGSSSLPLYITNRNYKSWAIINSELTKRYGVSETALRYRLSTLNLVIFVN
jgi:Zn-dependent peptidase ImmA (M78 family)